MGLTRRQVVASGCVLVAFGGENACATPDEMAEAMRLALGDGPLMQGRVRLDIPALVENGHSVPLGIVVDSPMTAADHVSDIYVFSPENPLPNISHFKLGPRCGKAEIKTTIRLATTQLVHVVAVMNDRSRWIATEEVEVTTAACFDPT